MAAKTGSLITSLAAAGALAVAAARDVPVQVQDKLALIQRKPEAALLHDLQDETPYEHPLPTGTVGIPSGVPPSAPSSVTPQPFLARHDWRALQVYAQAATSAR